jgi:hypothetical protein
MIKRIRYVKCDDGKVRNKNIIVHDAEPYNIVINGNEFTIVNSDGIILTGNGRTHHDTRIEVKKALENRGVRFTKESRRKRKRAKRT